MKDEREKLLNDLFRKARLMKPDTGALEEHFETRLMASMEEKRSDQALWSVWTWRLVPLFAVMVIVVGIGNFAMDYGNSGDPFAAFTSADDDYQITSMIAGG
jgi:hypothetical protein